MTDDPAPDDRKEPTLHDLNRELGLLLRQRRIAARLTQAALGKRVGLTFQQVQKYEAGQNRISVARLLTFANALQISLSELLPAVFDGSVERRQLEARARAHYDRHTKVWGPDWDALDAHDVYQQALRVTALAAAKTSR